MGASAVIAMHTHCPQGYEIYNNAPVVYSMGNFFFPHRDDINNPKLPPWYHGYMTELEFDKNSVNIKTIPYKFSIDKITVLKGNELEYFNKYLTYISDIIKDDKKLSDYFDAWCLKRCRLSNTSIEFNEDMIEAQDKNVAYLRNIFSCEAHSELWRNYYTLCYEKRHHNSEHLIEEIELLQKLKLS